MSSKENKNGRFEKSVVLRAAKWIAGGIVAYAAFGFLALPPLAKHFAEPAISEVLGRKVSIGEIAFNPFTLALTVRDLSVAEAQADAAEPALALGLVRADLQLESIFRGGAVLRELRVESPRVQLVRQDESRLNWSDVIERLAARPKTDDAPALFSVGNIELIGGAVSVDDRVVGLRHELSDLHVAVPFVSNLPVKVDLFVEPVISAAVNGRPFQLTGRTRPFRNERDTVLDVSIDAFDFTPYFAYVPMERRFALPEGRLTTKLEIGFLQPVDGKPEVRLGGDLSITDLRLEEPDGKPVLKLPKLAVSLGDVRPLDGQFAIARIEVAAPELHVLRESDGSLNLMRLVPPPSAKAAPEAQPQVASDAPAAQFSIDRFAIDGGVLSVEDRAAAARGEPFRTRFGEISLAVTGLSNKPDAVANLALQLGSEAAEKISQEGTLRLQPLVAEGRLSAEGLDIPRYAPYYAAALPGGEIRKGKLDAQVAYRIEPARGDAGISLTADAVALKEFVLALRGQKAPAVQVGRLQINEAAIALADRKVSVGGVELGAASVALIKGKDGTIDLAGIAGSGQATTPPGKGQKTPGDERPWMLELKRLAVADTNVRFEDRTQQTPIVFLAEKTKLTAQNLSTAKGSVAQIELASTINKRGKAAISGKVGIAPLKGELRLDFANVDLLPLQPYVAEQLNISISRGQLSTRSNLSVDGSGSELRARFQGDVGVTRFASIDNVFATDFVRWEKLAISGVDAQLAPLALTVREIALDDFYTRLILDEKGRLNLREIRAHGGDPAPAQADASPAPAPEPAPASAPASAAASAEPPPRISIGKIAISKGNVAFSDRFVRPNYDANLTGMGGQLVGLSSDPSTIARLDLQGKVDNAAPVTVSGELNPFRQDRYLKIAAAVKDFELTGLTSYSGKYVGYGIEKGKLSADLNYSVEERRLSATNRVFIDQFTFGEKIDSPDALNLPVRLAVSLLKNSRGEIDLQVPVGGSLDDPQFSVGGIILRAFINLIGKAITSPFALLGSMLGGGEELSYVDFAPGAAGILPAAQDKLNNLIKALSDRPAVKLEITAYADPESDPDGVRRELLARQVKAAWLKERLRKGEEAPSLDDLVLAPQDYADSLRKVYRDADFKRPRNAVGLLKDLPAAEMEALLLANIKVDEAALHALAQRRGQSIKDRLLQGGTIASERIFLLAPKVEPAKEGDEAGAGRRAQFSLR